MLTRWSPLPPPIFPSSSERNNLIREYIEVVRSDLVGIDIGPDFFGYFMPSEEANRFSLFRDTLHPNSLGYSVMSVLWHNALAPPGSELPLPFVLEDLTVSTGQNLQQDLLEVGSSYYIDEAFSLTGNLPDGIAMGRLVMMPNADRDEVGDTYLSFEVDRSVAVYVAYDTNAAAIPSWLDSFTPTPLRLSTTSPIAPSFDLYHKSYGPGPITLGGNKYGGETGANANYFVIVVDD